MPVGELPAYFRKAARAAETLRKEGVDIVFVCGCEITMFNQGIIPGETLMDRLAWFVKFSQNITGSEAENEMRKKSVQLNDILREVTSAVRESYTGLMTYAAGVWESVDWSRFNITGIDYYRYGESAEEYVAGLGRYRTDKTFMVMEVGCCSYEGAAARGGGGFMLLEGMNPDGSGKFAENVVPVRSEQEQADYVGEQLELLSKADVEGVFIYVFSFPIYRLGEGARDMDMMSFSLVKTFPEEDPRSRHMPPWAPKKAFKRIADFYQRY